MFGSALLLHGSSSSIYGTDLTLARLIYLCRRSSTVDPDLLYRSVPTAKRPAGLSRPQYDHQFITRLLGCDTTRPSKRHCGTK